MAVHNEIGKIGEDFAVSFLVSEGYSVLFRNWRPSHGRAEVDVILKRGNLIVFVEVKTRTSIFFGEPEEYVSPDKMMHLFDASSQFLANNPFSEFVTIRFDVVAIVLSKNGHHLLSYHHITHAFEPSPYFFK